MMILYKSCIQLLDTLQYNLTNLSESDLDDIVTHVGIAPVYPGDAGYADYEGKLDQVKTILSGLFQFVN